MVEPTGSFRVSNVMKNLLPTLALGATLAIGACSSPERPPGSNTSESVMTEVPSNAASVGKAAKADAGSGKARSAAATERGNPKVLRLEGLDDLEIGRPVPKGSAWAEHGAQESEGCRTLSSPDFPGAYAIVQDGAVRRISVGQRSGLKLIEGIGVGSSEKDVLAAFPGFRSEPHKYVEAPGKYLTAPNAAGGDVALRFEIGLDRKVTMMHVGTMPVLGYVEGCS